MGSFSTIGSFIRNSNCQMVTMQTHRHKHVCTHSAVPSLPLTLFINLCLSMQHFISTNFWLWSAGACMLSHFLLVVAPLLRQKQQQRIFFFHSNNLALYVWQSLLLLTPLKVLWKVKAHKFMPIWSLSKFLVLGQIMNVRNEEQWVQLSCIWEAPPQRDVF